MSLFARMAERGHEQLAFWSEPEAGYRGVIAIHDTTLGPALGGTRLWRYETEDEAVEDVLRLSRGMTYKAAVAGLDLGGGKSVILKPEGDFDRAALFRAHGRAVEALGGRYITAEDVGTTTADMELIRAETSHVVGLRGGLGDPSPVTAFGVYQGIRAAAAFRYGDASLEGRHVAVQGLGNVGYFLCMDLYAEDARLTVTDIDAEKVARAAEDFGADGCDPDAIYEVEADIFAPCALGGVVNDETLERFRFDIVAGSANNQLASIERHGPAIQGRGILYAPDYVVNAGGLINVFGELHGWTHEQAKEKATEIHETLLSIFERAEAERIPTSEAADGLAEARLDAARRR